MVRKTFFILSIFAACLFTANAATVSGVVKENDSAGAAINAAIVTLTRTGGGGTVVIDTTDASGAYSFTNVAGSAATPVSYRITATKTGYRVSAGSTVRVNDSTGAFTQNLYLIPTGTAGNYTVSGTIYDSAAGSALTPLAGAQVILRPTFGIGGATPDTVRSAATTGAYTIDSVAVGTYTLVVSMSGYVTQTLNVTVTAANVTQNVKLLHAVTASITGTVTDSSTTTALVGVKIYLLTRGGVGAGTIIDSTTTAAGGSYSITNVPSSAAGVNYTVRATMTDYVTSNTNVTVTGTTAQTVNIKLVPITMASITGTVTDSSSSGVAPLTNVKVYLRTTGGGATAIDSVVTGSAGTYTFSDVPSGVTYTVRAVATGYVTSNTTVNVTGTAPLTVNIRMVKTPSGNLYIIVKARADSSAVSGAAVTAINGATTLSATTASSGLVSFVGVATGNYAITVSAANYTAISTNTTLTANASDTVKIYMVAAANGTKTLKGVVVDSSSATKAPLQHVAVVLTIQGAGVGGGTLTLIDSTDASGAFTIVGIPVARTTGAVTATLANYRTFTNAAVALGPANTADTTTLRIALVPMPSSINSPDAMLHSGVPEFSVSSAGILRLNNFNDAGVVRVFSMNGKMLLKTGFAAHATSLAFPSRLSKSGSTYIVRITQKSGVISKQIMMP